MKIKFFLKSLILSCLFFVASFFLAASASAAPRLYFDPAAASPQKNTNFQVNVVIDAETNSAFGADAVIYFPSEITVKTVANGGFFTDFSYAVGSGQLELHGFFSALFASRTGSGNLATLTLSSSKDLGTSVLSFVCTTGGSDTEILNTQGVNILSCSSLNQLSLTYSTTNPSPTPNPTDNNNNGSTNGPTNACGGTCGSNYNCDAGLYCYQGFCRNPFCNTVTNCVCSTATPTVKPTLKPLAKTTPLVVTLAKTTPYPTPRASSTPQVTPIAQDQSKLNMVSPMIIWLGGGLIALIVILIIVSLFKKKGPPQIKPPTTVHSVEPPMSQPQAPVNQWQNPPSQI